jgi:hypothetical protein
MAVAMLIDNPNGSQEIYEQLRERIGLDKPAGGILHVAGPSPNGGWRVIEIWETDEDAKPRQSAPRRRLHPSSGPSTTT